MENFKYKLVKSPFQLYAAGVFWVEYALIFPLYLWYHYIIATALSIFVYFTFGRIFPPKQVKITLPYKAPTSGVSDVDKMIKDAEDTMKKIESSRNKIVSFNAPLAENITKIIYCGRKIMEYLTINTNKISLLRRFLNYYLPTLEKLSRSYIVFKIHSEDGKNASESMPDIENAVQAMESVFEKQLDKLLDDVALDISTDIDVLETMLNNGGINTND